MVSHTGVRLTPRSRQICSTFTFEPGGKTWLRMRSRTVRYTRSLRLSWSRGAMAARGAVERDGDMAPYSWRAGRRCQSGFHLTRHMKCRISARFEKPPQRGGADPNQVLGPGPERTPGQRRSVMTRAMRALSTALAVLFAVGVPTAWAQETVKVGVIQPLSGPVAASGNYVRMGAEIARDWINAKGGVLGRKVELLIEDNKSDPKEAATAAEKLIVRDKVPVIMGAWGSSMTLAAMPKLEEYGVPMVVETSSAASITKRGNPWIFRISPPSEMEAVGLEPYVDKLAIKKADFLAVNTDWGRGSIQAF